MANWMNPIQQQVNRTGDIMMYGDQVRRQNDLDVLRKQQFEQERDQNAFAMALKMRQLKDEEAQRNALANAFGGGGIDLSSADGLIQAGRMLAMNGDPKGLELITKGQELLGKGTDQFPGLTGTAKNLAIIKGRMPTEEELRNYNLSTRQQVNVGVNMPAQETEFRKAYGKGLAEDYRTMQQESQQAHVNLARLDRAESLATRINTGKLAPTAQSIKAVIQDLGFDPTKLGLTPDVGLAQALNMVSLDLTMDAVQRTKGAVSDKEMALFAQMAPNLGNTIEGNLLIIKMSKMLHQNKIKVASMARDYMAKHGRFDEGFQDSLNKFYEQHPLFTQEIYKEVNRIVGAASEAQGRGLTTPPAPQYKDTSDDQLKQMLGL